MSDPDSQQFLLDIDRDHVWHPYSSMKSPLPPLLVKSAQGSKLLLEDGTELIDAMSSWWSVIHGYNHPTLNAAAKNQIDQMSHVMFGGLTHKPAIELASKLIELSPPGLEKVFLCDTGSVSVEVALKMATQYWRGVGRPEKNRFAAFRGGYHGDTRAAMSVSDPVTGMHDMFQGILREQIFLPRPPSGFDNPPDPQTLNQLRDSLSKIANECAAVIVEPVVQGAGGMYFYPPEFLSSIAQLCKELDILLIADEIATGFGRTGRFFACEHAAIEPDILCLGKALTGGYLTQAATLCSERIADGISASEAGVFMHGPTFMANPLSCALALASISLLEQDNWMKKVKSIETQLKDELLALNQQSPRGNIKEARVLGAIGVLETEKAVNMEKITPILRKHQVWLRPFGRLVYTMPPYICSEKDIAQICAAMVEVSQCA